MYLIFIHTVCETKFFHGSVGHYVIKRLKNYTDKEFLMYYI